MSASQTAVKEYSIIDRFERTMTVGRLGHGGQVVTPGQLCTTQRLPGLEWLVNRLLLVADQWNEQPRSEDEGLL